MIRYIGYNKCSIKIVSDHIFESSDLKFLQLPADLINVSSLDLIKFYQVLNDSVCKKTQPKVAKELKIALVGNWKQQCGISTYAENLWPEVIKHVKDFKLFIEYVDNPTSPIEKVGNKEFSGCAVVCWKRGDSLKHLIEQIKAYNPDIVWFQHEYGLWPNFRYWLAMMTQLSDYKIVVTMHSVFLHEDKSVCEASIPQIIVHLDSAKTVLKESKKIPGKVDVIPHGCFVPNQNKKLWNCYRSNHTIIQFGFGFSYKGFENSIRAVSLLKQKYEDVFLTILFSESEQNRISHQNYYILLKTLIETLDIKENVAIIRGFQSDETLDAYIRTNKVAIFPYLPSKEHECFGSSGAAPYTMAKEIPVITSSIHHFENLPTIKADEPEQIALELDKLFDDEKYAADQVEKQNQYLNDNSWENIAKKYIELFEK